MAVFKVRLHEGSDAIRFPDEIVQRYKNKRIKILELDLLDEVTSGTGNWIAKGSAFTTDPNGTSSVLTPGIVSGNAADQTSTGTGAQSTTWIGVVNDGTRKKTAYPYDVVARTVELTGTTTASASAEWVRLSKVNVKTVGSGGMPAGDLTVMTSSAGTITTISAGSQESVGQKFWVPKGWAACCFRVDWQQVSAPSAANVARVYIAYSEFQNDPYINGTSTQKLYDEIAINAYQPNGSMPLRNTPLIAATNNTSYIQLYDSLIGAAVTYALKFYILLIDMYGGSFE